MGAKSEIKRYGKVVVFEHWAMMILVFILSITGIFLYRDWIIDTFHIYGAEMYVPTPRFTLELHQYAAIFLLIPATIHFFAHIGQKEKPIVPKQSSLELKAALYSLLYLVFLSKKQERGSGGKYLKSQKIIYAFTIYVLGLAAITGYFYLMGILGEYMLNAHVVAGVLVLLVVIHRIALMIRRRDKVAIRSILATGTMPEWYVKKNHKVWYDELVGMGVIKDRGPTNTETKGKTKEKKEKKMVKDKKPSFTPPQPSKNG